jgi:hypothetical protein
MVCRSRLPSRALGLVLICACADIQIIAAPEQHARNATTLEPVHPFETSRALKEWRQRLNDEARTTTTHATHESGHDAATPADDDVPTGDTACSIELHAPAGTYFIYSHMFSLQARVSPGCGIERFSAGMTGGDEPLRAIEISVNGRTAHPRRRHLQNDYLFIPDFPTLFEWWGNAANASLSPLLANFPITCDLRISVLKDADRQGRRELGQENTFYISERTPYISIRDANVQGSRELGHVSHQFHVSYSELGQDLWVARDLFPGQVICIERVLLPM